MKVGNSSISYNMWFARRRGFSTVKSVPYWKVFKYGRFGTQLVPIGTFCYDQLQLYILEHPATYIAYPRKTTEKRPIAQK